MIGLLCVVDRVSCPQGLRREHLCRSWFVSRNILHFSSDLDFFSANATKIEEKSVEKIFKLDFLGNETESQKTKTDDFFAISKAIIHHVGCRCGQNVRNYNSTPRARTNFSPFAILTPFSPFAHHASLWDVSSGLELSGPKIFSKKSHRSKKL